MQMRCKDDANVYYVMPGVNRKTIAVSSCCRCGSEMPSQTHKSEVQLLLTGGKDLGYAPQYLLAAVHIDCSMKKLVCTIVT